MLSYEYFTSIFFKIHLFTPLYFRTCLFSRVLQSCMCCPAHTSVVFSGHPIGGILVSPGSGTVAVAEQAWLAYPWVDGCQSSGFQITVPKSGACSLPLSAVWDVLRLCHPARCGWEGGDCWCHSSGLSAGHSAALHLSGLLAASVG